MSLSNPKLAATKDGLFRRWVMGPIIRQLTQGTSPHKVAQAIAFGITLGIFPIIGTTTLLSLMKKDPGAAVNSLIIVGIDKDTGVAWNSASPNR